MSTSLPEAPWLAQGEEKHQAVQAIFADVAPSYDLLNSLLSFGLHHRWRQAAVNELMIRSGDACLDICCGTGDFLLPLRRAAGSDAKVVGLDFCPPMLERARGKVDSGVQLVAGDAMDLPFADGEFQAATMGWGLRNVPDASRALAEAARVLAPCGRFAILDMAPPTDDFMGRASSFAFGTVTPFLGSLFGKTTAYKYLPESARRFLTPEQLSASLRSVGFENVRQSKLFFGTICLTVASRCQS